MLPGSSQAISAGGSRQESQSNQRSHCGCYSRKKLLSPAANRLRTSPSGRSITEVDDGHLRCPGGGIVSNVWLPFKITAPPAELNELRITKLNVFYSTASARADAPQVAEKPPARDSTTAGCSDQTRDPVPQRLSG